ncbi:hypothetical protein BU16DRAFT_523571 [Lophium mytilinum]|uniref:BTB domain-containing protein n=1 Tax=Lophium mytilinum TaxID=390894 RepID=A0A6A6R8C0_9PEZI|nr:hypothetical protein BU16DRAFT_523571 [Lophium mytilinum]
MSASVRPVFSADILTSPTVEVRVGRDPHTRRWYLPEDLLCQTSAFFRAACKGAFKEAQERLISLPEDEPEIFELFIQWLFSKGYYFTPEPLEDLPAETTEGGSKLGIHKPRTNIRAWVLGDKLGVVGFKNYAMDQIGVNHAPRHVNNRSASTHLYKIRADDILYVCQNTAPDSKLFNYLLVMVSVGWNDAKNFTCQTTETFEALQELCKMDDATQFIALLLSNFNKSKVERDRFPTTLSSARYHEEDDAVKSSPGTVATHQDPPERGAQSEYQLNYFATNGVHLNNSDLTMIFNDKACRYDIRRIISSTLTVVGQISLHNSFSTRECAESRSLRLSRPFSYPPTLWFDLRFTDQESFVKFGDSLPKYYTRVKVTREEMTRDFLNSV